MSIVPYTCSKDTQKTSIFLVVETLGQKNALNSVFAEDTKPPSRHFVSQEERTHFQAHE